MLQPERAAAGCVGGAEEDTPDVEEAAAGAGGELDAVPGTALVAGSGAVVAGGGALAAGAGIDASVTIFGLSQLPVT